MECIACRTPLPWTLFNTGPAKCPACGRMFEGTAFPALLKPPQTGKDAEPLLEDSAACYYHATKKAEVHCDHCGRFLCALCDIEFNTKHMCTVCLQQGKKNETMPELVTSRILHDNVAMGIALIPMLVFYFTIFTAPIAIFYSIKYWNKPTSLLPRTRIRFVVAFIMSALQIAGWGVAIFFIVQSIRKA